jgi:hypothetical protein
VSSWELVRAGASVGFILAIMRSSVVVANFYAGPDITSALAGGSLRTCTRPTLNQRNESARIYEHPP